MPVCKVRVRRDLFHPAAPAACSSSGHQRWRREITPVTPISAAEMISPFYSVLFLGQDKNDRLRTKIAEHSVWKMLCCSSSRPAPPSQPAASSYASYWFLYPNIYTGTTPSECNYVGIKVLYTSIDYEINKLIYTAVTAFTSGYLHRFNGTSVVKAIQLVSPDKTSA